MCQKLRQEVVSKKDLKLLEVEKLFINDLVKDISTEENRQADYEDLRLKEFLLVDMRKESEN